MSDPNALKIKATAPNGEEYVATFLPDKGMNFISFRKGDVEVIDQTTLPLFEERFAGLGAMIGPHFHHRDTIPEVKNPELFPHIEKLIQKGVKEPFSHGIGRYAPWKVALHTSSKIVAHLSGKERWQGVELQDLEGQNFNMSYIAEMKPDGLHITLSVESEKPSVVGLHTYYALDNRAGHVISTVQSEASDKGIKKPIPAAWLKNEHELDFNLNESVDLGFFPYPDPSTGKIVLQTGKRKVIVSYKTPSPHNSWQLWHPTDSTFVCIEPLSAENPRQPVLKSSELEIIIGIGP